MTRNRHPVRIAVNGYGVIGKRVADAVAAQDDMELVGVADLAIDYRLRVAAERGSPIYTSLADRRPVMEEAGISVAGTLDGTAHRVRSCRQRSGRAQLGVVTTLDAIELVRGDARMELR